MKSLLATSILVAVLTIPAVAEPLVNYTVTGSSGDWTLDFTVQNTLSSPFAIDFFGVKTGDHGITGSPGTFVPSIFLDFDILGTVYDNNWFDASFSSLAAGTTLSGFKVHLTDIVAPTSIGWFAFAKTDGYLLPYPESFDVSNPYYPGFLGTATVPDQGSTLFLVGGTLIFLASLPRSFFRRFAS